MQLTLISRISTNSVLGHLELSPRAMVIERSRNELRGWPRNLLFESEVSAGMSFRNEVRNLSEVSGQLAVGSGHRAVELISGINTNKVLCHLK